MGKKLKVGKARKDRFYHLAKETGYRSRAAFKLIQLNRKYEFLQTSNVIVDLCAAPGGWLQVAAENSPMSNHIIGIDLVPIPPIKNVTTLQEDITTEKCRQAIKKALHTAKADCFLNDGAPNVGKNWLHDAYQQAELTLHALKLATEFLRKGGWFITKLFRSKDYDSIMWVFQQMFKFVHATKPQASRNESAEIFVVCQNYLAPDRIDPKFLNPKFVFQEVVTTERPSIDLIHPEKKKRQREGYPEGDYTLFHTLNATEFITSDNFMELLAQSSQVVLDSDLISNHPQTTQEIKECLKDIKLLGKKDIRLLFSWRKKLHNDIGKQLDTNNTAEDEEEENAGEEEKEEKMELGESEEEEKDMEELETLLKKKKIEELQAMRRAKKKVQKAQAKQRTRIDLKMTIPGDRLDIQDDENIFDITKIKNRKQLNEVEKGDLSHFDGDILEDSDDEPKKKKTKYVERGEKLYQGWESEDSEEEAGKEEPDFDNMDENDNEEEDDIKENGNPLVVDMGERDRSIRAKQATWFDKDMLAELDEDADAEVDLEQIIPDVKNTKEKISSDKKKLKTDLKKPDKTKKKEKKSAVKNKVNDNTESEKEENGLMTDDDDDLDDDEEKDYFENYNISEHCVRKKKKDKVKKSVNKTENEIVDESDNSNESDDDENNKSDDNDNNDQSDGEDSSDSEDYNISKQMSSMSKDKKQRKAKKSGDLEIVPAEADGKDLRLDEEGLAIGAAMVSSRKRRREITDGAYHRYMFDDTGLPDWFITEESKHMKRPRPVTKAEVDEYRLKQKAIDAAPIKKVAEAKARKKKRLLAKQESARKKATAVSDNVDVSEKEKWQQIKQIYKKAGLLNKAKKNVTYVVAKKGAGRKVSKPAWVKGHYKVVDGRMKKDLRGEKRAESKRDAKSKKKKRRGR